MTDRYDTTIVRNHRVGIALFLDLLIRAAASLAKKARASPLVEVHDHCTTVVVRLSTVAEQ